MIYPPIVKSTQGAFSISDNNDYTVYFTLSSVTSIREILHIEIRVMRLSNNRSIVDTEIYPDGNIYYNWNEKSANYDLNTKQYSVLISTSDLIEPWLPGYLYKILLRFGSTPIYTDDSSFEAWLEGFTTWKQELIRNSTLSEWSTVMVIKAIEAPTIEIENAQVVHTDIISSQRVEPSLMPLFKGLYNSNILNKEALDTYKFDIYLGDSPSKGNHVESSGWLRHNSENDEDSYRFHTVLTQDLIYTVVYSIRTVNGYERSYDTTNAPAEYTFRVVLTYLSALEDIEFTADDSSSFAKENGCILLYFNSNKLFTGNLVISRSSEATNFTVYEDIKYLMYSTAEFNNLLAYQDFTVESGVRYRYALQQENSEEVRTDPIYSSEKGSHYVDFEYSYLYHDGVLLKLLFDQKMTSFKHTTLRNKLDTLGGKYPHLVLNGNAYYAEFPITGLISFHMDEDLTFFTLKTDGFYFGDELVIPRDKFVEEATARTASGGNTGSNYNHLTIDTDLTYNNIFVERKFREKVEEFLNNFDYKLYRSATEGNIVVSLMNVSLVPLESLGRMLFSFSATAYEVLDTKLTDLDEFGIISIGEFSSLASDEIKLSFGQVAWAMDGKDELKYNRGNKGFYHSIAGTSELDIYSLIKQLEEISIGGGYLYALYRITSIWIEPYPDINLAAEVLELLALRSDLLNQGYTEDSDEVLTLDREIEEYRHLQAAIDGPKATTTIMNIGGTEIMMMPNKIYHLRNEVRTIRLIAAQSPVIINYICELTQKADSHIGVVSSIDTSRIWGLVAGIFTGTDKILRTYDYNYITSKTYRIYNTRPDSTVIYNTWSGDVILDNTNINVYKTVNLYEIIKQETLEQVELMYHTRFTENENGELTDGTIFYTFVDITSLDIETDEGTLIYIGKSADGSDKVAIKVGPTGRYTLNPADSLIKYIAFYAPLFAIVNYKCIANQMTVVYKGG